MYIKSLTNIYFDPESLLPGIYSREAVQYEDKDECSRSYHIIANSEK